MKRAFTTEDKTNLKSNALNESSASKETNPRLSVVARNHGTELPRIKNQTFSKKQTVNLIILILGNIAVILLLLFIFFSL